MDEQKFFLLQIKRTNGNYDKGVVIKDSLSAVKQSYHAYLGAYAYGNNSGTDFVFVMITDTKGSIYMMELWPDEYTENNE